MKTILVSLFAVLCLSTGCKSTSRTIRNDIDKLHKVEVAQVVVKRNLDDKARNYVDNASKALRHRPENVRSKEEKVALRLLDDAQMIMGSPSPDTIRFNIEALINEDQSEMTKLTLSEAEAGRLIAERNKLAAEIEELNKKIVDNSAKLVVETHKSWFDRFKSWVSGTVVLVTIVVVVLLIFLPKIIKLFT